MRSIEGTGAQALPIVLDLRSQSSIAETLKHIAARLGHLDLLVNNAASNLRKPALDVTWAVVPLPLGDSLIGSDGELTGALEALGYTTGEAPTDDNARDDDAAPDN